MTDTRLLVKLVADAIPAWPDPPKNAPAIAAELGEPLHRIHGLIARIKEDLPQMPLISGADGYRWSRDPVDAKRHARKEIRYVSTRTRRSLLEGLLEPYYQGCDDASLNRARKRIEFILDDLTLLADIASRRREDDQAGADADAA